MYTKSQKISHLIISLGFIGQILGMLSVQYLSLDRSVKGLIFFLHKSTGSLLFVVAIIFLIQKLFSKASLKPGLAPWERVLAYCVHKVLWVTIITMPASGILMAFFSGKSLPFYGILTLGSPFEKSKSLAYFFHEAHHIFAYILFLCLFLHICGTVKHYWQKQYQHIDMVIFRS